MPFYQDNVQYEELVITGKQNPGTQTKSVIKLYNNSELTINFEGLFVNASNASIKNGVTLLKIIVDWGDGTDRDVLTPPVDLKEDAVLDVDLTWTTITHKYALKEKKNSLTLKIYAYNSAGDCLTITVPINILYQSLVQMGIKFKLVSANITNRNTVSYVLNDVNNKITIPVGQIRENPFNDPVTLDDNDTGPVLPIVP